MLIFNKINIFDTPDDESLKPENIKYRSYKFSFDVDKDGIKKKYTKTYYLEDIGIYLYIYDFDKGSFSEKIYVDNPPTLLRFQRISEIPYRFKIMNNETKYNQIKLLRIFQSIENTGYLNDLTNAENIDEYGNIHSFMYFYISCILPCVQHLNIYKNIYMLISDKPETDDSKEYNIKRSLGVDMFDNLPNFIKKDISYKIEGDETVKAHYPDEEQMESIKKRVYASYSTDPLNASAPSSNSNRK